MNGLVLYAGTNALSPAAIAAHDPQLGTRPPRVAGVPEAEAAAARAVAAAMRIPTADVRLPTATLANLAVYVALTDPGDTLAALPPWAGSHASHRADGAAGARGLRVVELPYDAERLDVDLDALPDFLARERPRLIVIGGTLMLFPHRLAPLVELAHTAEAAVLYDASHIAGLIAGGTFQDPLGDGADAMTFSTYKSFGGPPGGVIAAGDPAVTASVTGLTTNYNAGRLAALAVAAEELRRFGRDYARACIANARRLGAGLTAAGLEVLAAERGYTESHHLAVMAPEADPLARAAPGADSFAPDAAASRTDPLAPAAAVSGTDSLESDAAAFAATRLAAADIHASAALAPGPDGPVPVPVLRFGTQELTRRGFDEADMDEVAALLARVLVDGEPPERVREDVHALRARRSGIAFGFGEAPR